MPRKCYQNLRDLMPKAQETVLEIDLKALNHNFNHLRSKIKDSTKFMAVVKAFAYGSDADIIANYLESLNVDYFAVAYTTEAISLRNSGVTKPIMCCTLNLLILRISWSTSSNQAFITPRY